MEKKKKGVWELQVGKDKISVVNSSGSAQLLVNGKLQDIVPGISIGALLMGRLSSGKKIKVRLGGDFKLHCYIFINDDLVLED